jgi:hypothetical protein
MNRLIDTYMGYIYKMGTWEWFMVLMAVLVVGIWCMRGFGSRTSY